ncbi:MAG: glycosyltransferase family 2 protein [Clostridia bacterium]|nr:glycosyltransferase family 2 protein [Clostridia bacterium]
MPKFSVIVPIKNEKEYLPQALDSLIHQFSENFEAILVDGGSSDGSLALARDAANRYVDFFLIEGAFSNRFEAMNRGLKAAEGDYVLFLSAQDLMTDETIESLIDCIEHAEKKPDVITFRKYVFGEGRVPGFSNYDDLLAVLPSIPKYEYLLLDCLHPWAKAFRKSYLENRRLQFGTNNVFADMMFMFSAYTGARQIAGCPGACYRQRQRTISGTLPALEQPTAENFHAVLAAWNEIYAAAAEMIAADSGVDADGSESYLQQINYRIAGDLLERFYQRLWFSDDAAYDLFAQEYTARTARMEPKEKQRLQADYGYLGAPHVFRDRRHTDFLFSLALKFDSADAYAPFLDSLYAQTFPFFEVFIDGADADAIPEKYKDMPNLRAVDSDNYFAAARQAAAARVVLIVKDPEPLDIFTLEELRGSKAPIFMRQSAFARIRKSLRVKKSFQEKGINL